MAEGLTKAKELRETRSNLREQEKSILDKASEEKRSLTDEERTSLDKIDVDFRELTGDIERIERAEEREREMAAGQGARTVEDRAADNATEETADKPSTAEAFRAWGLYATEPTEERREILKRAGVKPNEFTLRMNTSAERREYLQKRAQSVGTDSEGGYTVPEGFRATLEDAMLAFGGVRQSRATVLRTATGNDLPLPTANDTDNKGALLAENAEDSEQDLTFGQAMLNAYKYTSNIIRVPVELLQDSAFDFDSMVGSKLSERLARITAEHFTTGTGVNQPEGVVTGATLGKTAAAVDAIVYLELVDLFHSVDPAYRMSAEWMFNDDVLKIARTLKNPDTNDYIWQESARAGAPDTLLSKPIRLNQEMASPAADAKSVLFGDMSKFNIRDVLDVKLVRLVERYAEFHQVAFVAISRHDSVLVDAGTNPVKVLQQAAA